MARLRGMELAEERFPLDGGVLAILRPRGLEDLVDAGTPTRDLYWATAWPSGRALAAEVSRRGLDGLRVLELGAGLGLPSLAAARGGARVLATDLRREALALLQRNARRTLGRRIETLVADIVEPPDELLAAAPFDLVLAADVLYRPELPPALAALLPTLLAPGGEALVAYPWSGQADPLVEALAGGLRSATLQLDVPGGQPTRRVFLVRIS